METQNFQNCRVKKSYRPEKVNVGSNHEKVTKSYWKIWFDRLNKSIAVCGAAAAYAIRN